MVAMKTIGVARSRGGSAGGDRDLEWEGFERRLARGRGECEASDDEQTFQHADARSLMMAP